MATPCKSELAAGLGRLRFQALVITLGLPALFLVLSLTSLEQLDSLPTICVWKRLTGTACPGCGTTHALSSIAHGEWAAAPGYNRNIYVLLPVLLWIWATQLRLLLTAFRARKVEQRVTS